VIAGLCWGMRGRWLRQWERAASEDLLPFYRRWIDARIQDARQSVAACVGAGVAIPLVVWFGAPPRSLFEHAALGSLPVVLLGSAVHLVAVRLPRLRRERKALE
jgi:hypothetical protein